MSSTKALDLIGHRFNRLVVESFAGIERRSGRSSRTWNCICDDGNRIVAHTQDLRKRSVQSCGCLHIEKITEQGHKNLKYPPKFDKQAWAREDRKKNRQRYARYKKNTLARLKHRVYDKLGNRCSNPHCLWQNEDGTRGCNDARCLQIDHVNGGGKKDRKKGIYRMYLQALKDEHNEYQILCANCNWIKLTVNAEWNSNKDSEPESPRG